MNEKKTKQNKTKQNKTKQNKTKTKEKKQTYYTSYSIQNMKMRLDVLLPQHEKQPTFGDAANGFPAK